MLKDKIKKRLTKWLKLRFAVLYIFGIWAIVSGHSTGESIARSAGVIFLGLAIRSWANCYAIKMDKLTTSGPYGYVRHPLYFGSFLIMLGFLIMLNVSWEISLIFVLIVIGGIYKLTIQSEEKMLLDKFGEQYRQYCESVHALFPRLTSYKGGEKWGASRERYFRSQEYKLIIWIVILMIVFHLKEEFLIKHEPLHLENIILIITAFFLAMLDVGSKSLFGKAKKTG